MSMSRFDRNEPASSALLRLGLGWILGLCTAGFTGCGSSSPSNSNLSPVAQDTAQSSDKDSSSERNGARPDPAEDKPPTDNVQPAETGQHPVSPEPTASPPSWTEKRLLLAAPGGPKILLLRVNADGRSLDEGFRDAVASIANELKVDFEGAPPKWEDLLALPLVRSGWIGNLVPSESQRAELLGLYDKNKDQLVQSDEFRLFATRGVARQSHLRVGAKKTRQTRSSFSAWGPLDTNDDGTIDKQEREQVPATLSRYDFDNDSVISRSEPKSAADDAENGMRSMTSSGGMLDSAGPIVFDSESKSAGVRRLIDEYGFGSEITRDAWWAWSDSDWNKLDTDVNGKLSTKELSAIESLEPNTSIECSFPVASKETKLPGGIRLVNRSESAESAEPNNAAMGLTQLSRKGWRSPQALVTFTFRDDHSPNSISFFNQRFEAAKNMPEFRQFVRARLQLPENAFEMLDELMKSVDTADSAKQPLSPPLRWLIPLRDFHVSATWTLSDDPWFVVLDSNSDGLLSANELAGGSRELARLDRNQDGVISLDEQPLAMEIELERRDERLMVGEVPDTNQAIPSTNSEGPAWFAAMDLNSDKTISRAEFLGNHTSFESMDRNKDGIIELGEVYSTP